MDWKEVGRLYYYFTSEETERKLDSIRPVYDNSLWVKDSPNSKYHGKIHKILRLHLIRYIDMNHTKGKKVACHEILNWFQKKYAVYCSKHTLLRDMLDIGLYHNPRKNKVRNNNITRIDQIRDYLISLHAMLKLD